MDCGYQPKSEIKTSCPTPCAECDLYKGNLCRKWRLEGSKPQPFKRDMFTDPKWADDKEFIPIDKVCREESIFGNYYIGLSDEDIERLKSGEIVHVGGEYGIFIGYKEDK